MSAEPIKNASTELAAAYIPEEILEPTPEVAPEATPEVAPEPEVKAAAPEPKPKPIVIPAAQPEPLQPLESAMAVIDELLRNRMRLLRRIEEGMDLMLIARASLLTIVVCMAALGATVGFYRGGVQIAFAGLKLPFALLLTAAFVAPAYSAFKIALGHKVSIKADFALILSSLALACLVTAALTPLLLLAIFDEVSYHKAILISVMLCGMGGLAGYVFFFRGMNRQIVRGHRLICISLLFVMGLVSTQMTWMLRPYFVRPTTVETPFLRASEGSFFDAVLQSTNSARGIYKTPVIDSYNGEGRRGGPR